MSIILSLLEMNDVQEGKSKLKIDSKIVVFSFCCKYVESLIYEFMKILAMVAIQDG